jgi:hypothetical protein
VISSLRPIDGAEEPEEAPDIGLLLPYNVIVRAEGLGSLAKSAREPDHQKRSSPSAAALILQGAEFTQVSCLAGSMIRRTRLRLPISRS